jgi:type I restriction enzyme S subunit
MPSDWEDVFLGEVAQDVTVGHVGPMAAEYVAEGVPFLRSLNVRPHAIDLTDVKYVRREFHEKLRKSALSPGDVVTVRTGKPGATAVVPASLSEANCSDVVITRPGHRLDPRWLSYYINGVASGFVASRLVGAVQQHFNVGAAREIALTMPPLSEQRDIGSTLGALDDKIESNISAIGQLEALGACLLESAVEVNSHGIPEYDSERRIGAILAVLETGSRPKGGVVDSLDGVVSLGAENVQSAGISTSSKFKRVSAEFAESMRRGRLRDGDVLVYKDGGTPGNFTPHVSAFGQGFPVDDATINEHVYRVRSGDGISQALLYWMLRSPWMDHEMRKRGTGVAIPGLNSSNFRDLPLPVLVDRDVGLLNDTLGPMLQSMLHLGAECAQLGALRDALLPELLSGRIRVSAPTGGEEVVA